MLGYRDKTIEFEDDEKLANAMLSFIKEVNPSLIITFYPGYSVHPDHDATGAAVVRAVKLLPAAARPTLHCVAFSNNCVKSSVRPILSIIFGGCEKARCDSCPDRSQTGMFGDVTEKLKNQDPQMMVWINNNDFGRINSIVKSPALKSPY